MTGAWFDVYIFTFLGVENTSVSASFFNALCDIIRESKKEQVITWK